ncbi:MAG: glycosyltransferase family 4 protein [Lachnospiraceae bacterium]|nr:glycosyltransferase family 4 protein [Lachnospiraceae bacterium]
MEKKKVAVVLVTEPESGGGYQYALTIAECLKELSDTHYELLAIVTNSIWKRWCRNNGIRYITPDLPKSTIEQMKKNLRFPVYSRLYNTYLTEFGKVLRKEKIDVLFFTEQSMYIPNLKTKIITPVHDLMHRYEPEFPEVKCDYQRRELLFKCQAKYADFILTDSKLGKKQFAESYLRTNKKKPHIVSLPFIVPDHIGKVKEEYIKVPDKYLFYPAQFWKHKNHMNLVKAINILKHSIEDVHLVLVGSEKNCCDEIKRYISGNGLEDNITIYGFVSNGNITYLYKHAVGMIMPSYFGPTNIPPLEAMALGCPAAVSNKYAMPEQVGKAGLLFDPDSPEEIAECIRKLWSDNELREEMIEEGYQRIYTWTKPKFKKRIFKVIERCLVQ